ncbi:hypothetical protein KKC32_01635 [Patescibacteria group bacterium]|nr:hypothetical protein [Patescibacteria group bacterium]
MSIPASFWPIFFKQEIITAFVGQCVCFCVNDRDKRRQFVFVYPEEGNTAVPSVEELSKVFNFAMKGTPISDPEQIPIPYAELRSILGVTIREKHTGAKQMCAIYPIWLPEKGMVWSDGQIQILSFSVPRQEVKEIKRLSENHIVLYQKYFEKSGQLHLICLLRDGASVRLSPAILIRATTHGRVEIVQDSLAFN